MKYVVFLCDGMSDYKQEFLNNKTPLMVANKPYIDELCPFSEVGLCQTVPNGMKPGSDVANLSVLGYDVLSSYTGRSPLEAASIGIDLKDTDVCARANLVTVSGEENYHDKKMIDYSAGEISTREAKILIEHLSEKLNTNSLKLYSGVSYRHCLVKDNGVVAGDLTPPHDITGRPIKEYLPKSNAGKEYLTLQEKSYTLLKEHPINQERIKKGKNPANSLWFWGEGTKPRLESFESKFSLKGGVISAVDLLKGIAKLTGMQVIEVDGATGNFDTNFKGKAEACINALKSGLDYVYVHMEAPDECGHHGDAEHKIYSIEQIDKEVIAPVTEWLKNSKEDFSILIMPDHPTPLNTKTHAKDSVPFLLYKSNKRFTGNTAKVYNEDTARDTGITVSSGIELMKKFLEK